MRLLNEALRLFSAGVLAFALTATLSAQDSAQKQADRQQNETSITGCLTKDASGGYTIADEKTGAKTSVTGPTDLEKHSANHKVTLTGTSKMDGGKSVFNVTKIQHVAAECKAPGQ